LLRQKNSANAFKLCTPTDQPAIDEFVVQWVAGHSLHDVALRLLVRQRDRRHEVGAKVNAEDRDGAERQRNVGEDEYQERRNLRDVARQRVRDRLLQVVEDQPTCKLRE